MLRRLSTLCRIMRLMSWSGLISTSALLSARDTVPAIMIETLRLLRVTSPFTSQSSKVFSSRPPSSKDTVGENHPLRKLLSKCIWPTSCSAISKMSRRLSEVQRYLRGPSAASTRRLMRAHRRMAHASPFRRISLRLCGWHLSEALLRR